MRKPTKYCKVSQNEENAFQKMHGIHGAANSGVTLFFWGGPWEIFNLAFFFFYLAATMSGIAASFQVRSLDGQVDEHEKTKFFSNKLGNAVSLT